MDENAKILLKVENLKIHYKIKKNSSITTTYLLSKAVDGVSYDVYEGETFGIVGESGCGKSTTGKAVVGLLEPTEGSIQYRGKEVTSLNRMERAKHIQMIFQDPFSSLDPRMTCGRCIEEPLKVHGMKDAAKRKETCLQLMRDVGLREDYYTRYPHEFSGGQRQRIGVARAIALHPDLVICDEPVSALDVSIQAQILNLMQDLQKKYNLTYIFISHNLSVVKHLCDRIAVMYLGHIVELADKNTLFDDPKHPYTFALLDAIPVADPDIKSMKGELKGDVPSPMNPPTGCCFHTRCPYADEKCAKEVPALSEYAKGHLVACHYAGKIKQD